MIHVFHGFLGSTTDFLFLKNSNVVLHDLTKLDPVPDIQEDDILIGYSMGGRIALEIAHRCNYKIKKIVLINAHPGISNEEERIQREQWDSEIVKKLTHLSSSDFINYWNGLLIFSHDLPLKGVSDEHYKKSARLFSDFRLSKQINYLPEVINHKEKFIWLIGTQDTKYLQLAKNVLAPNGIKYHLVEGGHRLFQNPEGIKKILEAEGIL